LSVRLAELSQARSFYDRAVSLYEQVGARLGLANLYCSLGNLLHQERKYAEAKTHYERSIALAVEIDDPFTRARTQVFMLPTLMALSQHREALAAALDALVYFLQIKLDPAIEATVGAIQNLRQQMGAGVFDPLWAELTGGQPLPEWLR
jgi:tetratricopeptide (TPR) repeat protein